MKERFDEVTPGARETGDSGIVGLGSSFMALSSLVWLLFEGMRPVLGAG
jgi:hypothetical protein